MLLTTEFRYTYEMISVYLYLPQPATAFKGAYESLGLHASGGKSVNMQKIWHLLQVTSNHLLFLSVICMISFELVTLSWYKISNC